MSHYVAEIVIPPTDNVQESIRQVMEHFCDEDEDGKKDVSDWWDFWIIGGRFNGHKTTARLDPERLKAFHVLLNELKVTVSGLVCGKEELNPVSQIPMVDALWREWFPGAGAVCPLFHHSNDQYRKDGHYPEDVCTVADLPSLLICTRLIVAGPHWQDKTKLEAEHMLVAEFWNRCNWQKTDFDGNVKAGLEKIAGKKTKDAPFAPDWLVATVDYHN